MVYITKWLFSLNIDKRNGGDKLTISLDLISMDVAITVRNVYEFPAHMFGGMPTNFFGQQFSCNSSKIFKWNVSWRYINWTIKGVGIFLDSVKLTRFKNLNPLPLLFESHFSKDDFTNT